MITNTILIDVWKELETHEVFLTYLKCPIGTPLIS